MPARHGDRLGPAKGKKKAGSDWHMGKNIAKSDSTRDAAGDRCLSFVRLRLTVHELGWLTDVGSAARHSDTSPFSKRGLDSPFM